MLHRLIAALFGSVAEGIDKRMGSERDGARQPWSGSYHPAARTRSGNGRRMAHIRAARKARRARR